MRNDKQKKIFFSFFKKIRTQPLSFINHPDPQGYGPSSPHNDYHHHHNPSSDPYHNELINYNDAIEEAQAHLELNEELLAQNQILGTNQSKSISETIKSAYNEVTNNVDKKKQNEEKDEEIDNNFNQISSCLNRLKTIGLDMHDELVHHHGMIEDLQVAVNKTEEDTEKVTRVMRRFEI